MVKRFMRQFRYGGKGFTLIELLLVVAILGVLTAIVIPNIGRFVGNGKTESDEAELHNIQIRVMAVMANNDADELDSAVSATDDMANVTDDGGATTPPLPEEPKPSPLESPEVPNYTITLLSFRPALCYISDAAFAGKVRNDSSVTLKNIQVVITSYDKNHNIISIDWRRINRRELPPGETSIFSITFRDHISAVSYGISFKLPEGQGNLVLSTGDVTPEVARDTAPKWVGITSGG